MLNTEKIKTVLLITNFLVIASIGSIFILDSSADDKDTVDEQIVLGANTEVVQIEEEMEYGYVPLNICTEDTCQTISAETVSAFYEEGILQKGALSEYLLWHIIPYFEYYYGGKERVSNAHGDFLIWSKEIRPDFTNITNEVADILDKRVQGETISTYTIPVKMQPGTDGNYATKYMEVDNSNQKLYVWMDGKVVRTITLSGPVYGFQVYGVFPIVDKGLSPIAPGGKYMPYWMAFYYSKKQDSWYGLHALIWWYDANGKKVYESLNNIGTRQSAGCIRMLLEDAKYLYENFEKGDILLIHE